MALVYRRNKFKLKIKKRLVIGKTVTRMSNQKLLNYSALGFRNPNVGKSL